MNHVLIHCDVKYKRASTTEDVFGFVEFFKKCIRAYLIYAIIAIAIIILSEWIV